MTAAALPRTPHPGEFDTDQIDRHLQTLRTRLVKQREEGWYLEEAETLRRIDRVLDRRLVAMAGEAG